MFVLDLQNICEVQHIPALTMAFVTMVDCLSVECWVFTDLHDILEIRFCASGLFWVIVDIPDICDISVREASSCVRDGCQTAHISISGYMPAKQVRSGVLISY